VSVERIRDFRRRLQRDAAEEVVPLGLGDAILSPSIRDVYDHNYLSVEEPAAGAEELVAATDEALEASFHRRAIAERGAPGLDGAFRELGYTLSTHLVLEHTREPDRAVDTSAIHEVPFETLEAPRVEAVLREPWGDHAVARQLNHAKRHIAAAVPTRFFAAVVDDEIAGWCELRERDGVAQIEDVEVLAGFRGRGLGRALVQAALDEGRRTAEVVFLEALADDWPRRLYAKLGFTVVDRRDFYTRLPHPLTRLRLRTPRLELRLATVAEQRQLFAVAAAGIHDPSSMPFGVAWTDDLQEEAYLAFHREKLASAAPEDWSIGFVAFLDGSPVGIQEIRGERFAATRTVDTGSFLGLPYQGRGLGTEMRSAVLSLAFDHLGAERATSGAIERNPQSLGVSAKLGYVEVGSHEVSPRGVPVEHVDLEVTRESFTPACDVEVRGLDPVRPLLGAA
jgi:RimJ/RimL family protein N-acetyltransferase